MSSKQLEALYPLTLAVRSLFHKLAHAADTLHQDTGMSAGMRAVLESLANHGPQTVPQIARARPVSRQHIQGFVNELLHAGYVHYVNNPAHRRSKLVQLTEAGAEKFAEVRSCETRALARMTLDVRPEDLTAATLVLKTLIEKFGGAEWLKITDEIKNKRGR